MLYRKPRVGQEVNAYCGKCKDERTHVVAAMDGETVRRVTCSMCGGTHNYKLKPTAKVAAAAAGGEAAKSTKKRATGSRRAKEADTFSIDPKRPVKS